MTVRLVEGDCRRSCMVSADAAVTDPPYELGFMSKGWDRTGVAFRPETWYAVLRALPPGGYLLAFGGTRTYHRLTCAVEDAGFEIRDCLLWLYGTGFPKGKGCLKPAWEPILLARRPGPRVLPLGIDECRVPTAEDTSRPGSMGVGSFSRMKVDQGCSPPTSDWNGVVEAAREPAGRYPANLAHDGSAEVLEAFAAFGPAGGGFGHRGKKGNGGDLQSDAGWGMKNTGETVGFGDTGTAARFFYCAKASKKERGEGNDHPTVKPLALMRWLVKLVCPPGGTVLDPFAGSGTTGVACMREERSAVLIENDAHSCDIIRRRLGVP